ncbi:hypothetical protein BJX68DRAFT_249356 [Aspergillus pseudodeflectus]|uniref:GH26 domain-containing protein n=1 Tax=Aspergillus pseudodeflectus TaxID=176178 RepID=A0ABR4JG75_9EURO
MRFSVAVAVGFLTACAYAQTPSYHYDFDLTAANYEDRASELGGAYRLSNINGHVDGGKTLFTAVWEKTPSDATDRQVFIDQTLDEFQATLASLKNTYHPIVLNGYLNAAGKTLFASIWESSPADIGFWDVTFENIYSVLDKRTKEYGALTPPIRPLWYSAYLAAPDDDRYALIWGVDHSQPNDNATNPDKPYYYGTAPAKYFHEYVVSAGIRGTMPVALDVVPLYGKPMFSSLWRKVAPANSYPNWSAYREINRKTMQAHLEEGARNGGRLLSLVAYNVQGVGMQYAAVIDDAPPAVRETYLPGQPLWPVVTTSASTVDCPPTSTTSVVRMTSSVTTTTTTTAKPTTTTTTMRTTTAARTTTTKPTTTTKKPTSATKPTTTTKKPTTTTTTKKPTTTATTKPVANGSPGWAAVIEKIRNAAVKKVVSKKAGA